MFSQHNKKLSRLELQSLQALSCCKKNVTSEHSQIFRFGALKVSKDKGNLRQTLQDLQADLFLSFEDELDRIKEMYEENKEKPPITHNAPTVASALLWIRQLIQRIEEPMKIFRENKLLMSNRVRL